MNIVESHLEWSDLDHWFTLDSWCKCEQERFGMQGSSYPSFGNLWR